MEEVGELSAEVIKEEGYTYKEADPQKTLEEAADVLVMLLSIVDDSGFTQDDLINKAMEKCDKWEKKIDQYTMRNIKDE